jgi:hypothetical protein
MYYIDRRIPLFANANKACNEQDPYNDFLIRNSWLKLTDSNERGLSNEGYYGIAFINNQGLDNEYPYKEIIIVNSINNNYWIKLKFKQNLLKQEIPSQLEYAYKFTIDIINNYPHYVFYFTGYLYGAVLSELLVVKIYEEANIRSEYSNSYQHNINVITFNSPGSYEIAEKLTCTEPFLRFRYNVTTFNPSNKMILDHLATNSHFYEINIVEERPFLHHDFGVPFSTFCASFDSKGGMNVVNNKPFYYWNDHEL